jgi:protein involved in ribonucleotide reduction
LMVGVVSSGNRNFGENFAISGNIISRNCSKPLLHKYELAGTPGDTTIIRNLMEQLINDNKLLRP